MSTNNSAIHPELLKMYNSFNYRRKVKRIATALKDLRNMNKGLKSKGDSFTPDCTTAHYFAQNIDTHSDRKNTKPKL